MVLLLTQSLLSLHLFGVAVSHNACNTFVGDVVQGYTQQALAVSSDPEHRFELALRLGEVQIAYQLASEAEV